MEEHPCKGSHDMGDYSKGFLLCLIPAGFVVDCKLYSDVGNLVRISARSGVVSCLPGY